MLVPIVAALVVVAFLAALSWGLRNRYVDESVKERSLPSDETPTLTYFAPPGQGPMVLVDAPVQSGFHASAEVVGGPQRLLIGSLQGRPDREGMRSIIVDASWTANDHAKPVDARPVRFVDEAE